MLREETSLLGTWETEAGGSQVQSHRTMVSRLSLMAGRGVYGFLWDAFLDFLIGWCCGTCLWSLKTEINELKKMSLKFFHATSVHLHPFFEMAFYRALAGSPGTHCIGQVGPKPQRSSCFCLPVLALEALTYVCVSGLGLFWTWLPHLTLLPWLGIRLC